MEKSGPGAGKFQPGQRVVAAGWAAGTWQDYIVQPEKSLVGNCGLVHTSDFRAARCSDSVAASRNNRCVTTLLPTG